MGRPQGPGRAGPRPHQAVSLGPLQAHGQGLPPHPPRYLTVTALSCPFQEPTVHRRGKSHALSLHLQVETQLDPQPLLPQGPTLREEGPWP